MRYQYLFIFLFLLPAKMFAQSADTDITGLWKGRLYNDSTQQFYKYEIAISEEKGKLTGFSHTWFLLDDKQYYGVKKVTIKKRDGKILIEDDELIANNYPVAPAKGIRQLNVLVLDASDSIMTLKGPFATNRTKKYAPLTGTIDLQRTNDYWQSALVPHLQELNLVNALSFIKDDKLLARNNAIIGAAQPTSISTRNTIIENKTKPAEINIPAPVMIKEDAIVKKEAVISNTNEPGRLEVNKSDTIYPIASNNSRLVKNTQLVAAIPITVPAITSTNKTTKPPVVLTEKNIPVAASKLAAADVFKRVTLLQQTVSFHSDSLQISLYDNGEVDGDTVSVLMNGNIIMAKERLSTNAIRKTIYIPQETDSVQLVMYAENLGQIPPNTGLLVVKDGKDLYEIRFSGDLQKNAAILFRRKKQ